MAFSYGFFDSKGLDRTYTAENFCDYLGSIICNGIQDNYGQKFSLTAATSGLKVTLGTGKAWIDGHYFINDSRYSIDLTEFQDESLPRYVTISIVLDTSENARKIAVEVTSGTPAENPTLPPFETTENRKRLLLYGVRLNVGATSLSSFDWYDYREDYNVCGYCRCILGKCKITEMLTKIDVINSIIKDYELQVEELNHKIDELQLKTDDLTGDIVQTGNLGDDIYYVLYSNGKLLVRGSGEMYNYNLNDNVSPLRGNNDIMSVVVSNGITSVGDCVFENCENLKNASLPESVKTIGDASFMQGDGTMGVVHGLENVNIPPKVTTISGSAFWGSAITSLNLPETVTEIGKYACRECYKLKSVRIEGSLVGEFMFTHCEKMTELILTSNLEKFGEHALNYCFSLETIIFEGTLKQWQAVKKGTSWDGHGGNNVSQSGLNKIQCIDGYMQYDAENSTWEEVSE